MTATRRLDRMLRYLPAIVLSAAYGATLTAGKVTLDNASTARANHLVQISSTNVHNLLHDPIRVLFASVIWVTGSDFYYWLVVGMAGLFLCALLAGARAAFAITFAAHVLATLVTEGVTWILVSTNVLSRGHLTQLDVGPSYVVVAALTFVVVRGNAWERLVAVVALIPLAVGVASDLGRWDIADSGHLIVAALVLSHTLVRGRARSSS